MNEAQTRLDNAPGRITTTGHKNPKKADYILEYKCTPALDLWSLATAGTQEPTLLCSLFLK